uniref:Uncharacterized protein n=1 Tax=viral metagenome TaxID=1070528 RepID=A0A6M3JK31_9ZZZZ
MTEIDNLKASAAIWINAASIEIDEFMLGVGEAEEVSNLDFKLLGQVQGHIERAREILKIK